MFGLRKSHARFQSETEGSMTVYGIFILMTMGALAGLMVDVATPAGRCRKPVARLA